MKAVRAMIAVVMMSATATAQPKVIGSMRGIVSARDVAMGESSVAALGDPGAWNSNPATVAGIRRMGGHFITGRRSVLPGKYVTDWIGGGAWIAMPFANIAIHYVREGLGEFRETSRNGDPGDVHSEYNRTMTFTLGTTIFKSLSIGTNIEWVKEKTAAIGSPGRNVAEGSGVWVDFGAVYSLSGFMMHRDLRDKVHIGISLQDIGETFAYKDTHLSYEIAQWIRLGGAYDITVGDSASPTLRAALRAEYTRQGNGSSRNNSYGGIGLEATASNTVSVRLGAQFHPPYPPYLSRKRTLSLLFGAGINLHLKKVGIDMPLAVGIDYSTLPPSRYSSSSDENNAVPHLLELRMAYTGPLFK